MTVCEAEEERDGKVLEDPGCHRMGQNTAKESHLESSWATPDHLVKQSQDYSFGFLTGSHAA